MTYCLLPSCFQPQNPDDAKHCQTCGSALWLKQRYRPLDLLGQGGFGRTFLAVDEDLPSRPRLVIKQLSLQNAQPSSMAKATELFYREAEQLDRLGAHDQIPKLLAYCEQNRLLYLVQEWIDGQNLEQELRSTGLLTEPQIWEVLQGLLPVLKFVHQQQIVHRDLKPANIMRRSRDRALVLIDFGIAKLVPEDQSSPTGTVVGSPGYMAPEQQRGKPLPASDLYSLGVTCLYLMTQVSPLVLYDVTRDRWQWRQYLPPGYPVGDRLAAVLDKLIAPSLSQRYQSAQEVWLDVSRWQRVQTRLPQPATPAPPTPLPPDLIAAPTVISSPPPKLNYGTLQKALIAERWQQADDETRQLLQQAAGKSNREGLTQADVERLPCEVWQKLDWLWTHYSRQRFGFSPQVRLYISLEEDYHQFCHAVAWPTHAPHLAQTDYLNYRRRAPLAHLPSRQWAGGYQWWRHMQWLSDRFKQCRLL